LIQTGDEGHDIEQKEQYQEKVKSESCIFILNHTGRDKFKLSFKTISLSEKLPCLANN
jgi:hypothetical protein